MDIDIHREPSVLKKLPHEFSCQRFRVELAESFRDLARRLPHFKQTVKAIYCTVIFIIYLVIYASIVGI